MSIDGRFHKWLGSKMVDEKKRDSNSKLIGIAIAVIAIAMFGLAIYMGAGMH